MSFLSQAKWLKKGKAMTSDYITRLQSSRQYGTGTKTEI